MTEEKKDKTKRQTKAGMMEKNQSRTAGANSRRKSEKKPENTPKISKEKAENEAGGDKPPH